MEATTRWTEGKPWEIAWGEFRREGPEGSEDRVDGREAVGNSLGRALVGKERCGSDEEVDGRETVGNRTGRAPLGRSQMEATIGWTERKS